MKYLITSRLGYFGIVSSKKRLIEDQCILVYLDGVGVFATVYRQMKSTDKQHDYIIFNPLS